jgi:hypothetical protein
MLTAPLLPTTLTPPSLAPLSTPNTSPSTSLSLLKDPPAAQSIVVPSYAAGTVFAASGLAKSRTLSYTRSLENILYRNITLTSKTNSLRLIVSVLELLFAFKNAFKRYGIPILESGIHLIGSTATAIILEQENVGNGTAGASGSAGMPNLNPDVINDLDFVFKLQNAEKFSDILQIQEFALCSLLKTKRNIVISPYDCYTMFFHSAFCMDHNEDKWSLISLGSPETTVDIKVVYSCSRMYAFSIDSFEIELDALLNSAKKITQRKYKQPVRLDSSVPVKVHSNYPNFEEALFHLRHRLIMTDNFANIHHGLFRYCLELARGYRPLDPNLGEWDLVKHFWEEFGQVDVSVVTKSLAKFVAKHRKHWFCILTQMHYVISRFSQYHQRSFEVMEAIFKLMFRKT